VEYFAARTCERLGIQFEGIAPEALELLQQYPWPGNVRELRNLVETLITLERGAFITPEMVREYLQRSAPPSRVGYEPVPLERAIVAIRPERGGTHPPATFDDAVLLYRVLLDMRSELSELRRALSALTPLVEQLSEQLAFLRERVEAREDRENVIPLRDEADFRLDDIERRLIIAALKRFGGNRRLAARALGISERTLYRKLAQYGLGEVL
jgi:DNA-binding NtrC family response regulator